MVACGVGITTGLYSAFDKNNISSQEYVNLKGQEQVVNADYSRPAVVKCKGKDDLVEIKIVRGKNDEPKEAVVYCKPAQKPTK